MSQACDLEIEGLVVDVIDAADTLRFDLPRIDPASAYDLTGTGCANRRSRTEAVRDLSMVLLPAERVAILPPTKDFFL